MVAYVLVAKYAWQMLLAQGLDTVGSPALISRSGAAPEPPPQARQAYLGPYCAGITSSRCDVSSPITCMGARQQGAVGVFGLDRHIHAPLRQSGRCCRQRRRLWQWLPRYPRVPEAAARDRASPNAG
jgi:hypothetical protein